MHENAFMEMIHTIYRKDNRYQPDAYVFVRQALDVTVKMLDKPRTGTGRHVGGRELLEGIRHHALQEFGPMTRTVFESWGIRSTADFGEIVFNLVEYGVLGKTDNDSRADFKDGYDFHDAFDVPFLPDSARNIERQPPPAPPGHKRRKGRQDTGEDR